MYYKYDIGTGDNRNSNRHVILIYLRIRNRIHYIHTTKCIITMFQIYVHYQVG